MSPPTIQPLVHPIMHSPAVYQQTAQPTEQHTARPDARPASRLSLSPPVAAKSASRIPAPPTVSHRLPPPPTPSPVRELQSSVLPLPYTASPARDLQSAAQAVRCGDVAAAGAQSPTMTAAEAAVEAANRLSPGRIALQAVVEVGAEAGLQLDAEKRVGSFGPAAVASKVDEAERRAAKGSLEGDRRRSKPVEGAPRLHTSELALKRAAAIQSEVEAAAVDQQSAARASGQPERHSGVQPVSVKRASSPAKAAQSANRAVAIAAQRLAMLQVRAMRHCWLLPRLWLASARAFERWQRAARPVIKQPGARPGVIKHSTPNKSAPTPRSKDRFQATTPAPAATASEGPPASVALTVAGSRGGPKGQSAALERSGMRRAISLEADRRASQGPSTSRVIPAAELASTQAGQQAGAQTERAAGGDGADSRRARAAAEAAVADIRRDAAARVLSAQRSLASKEREHAVLARQLRTTRVVLLHRTLRFYLARVALSWSLRARSRALCRWRLLLYQTRDSRAIAAELRAEVQAGRQAVAPGSVPRESSRKRSEIPSAVRVRVGKTGGQTGRQPDQPAPPPDAAPPLLGDSLVGELALLYGGPPGRPWPPPDSLYNRTAGSTPGRTPGKTPGQTPVSIPGRRRGPISRATKRVSWHGQAPMPPPPSPGFTPTQPAITPAFPPGFPPALSPGVQTGAPPTEDGVQAAVAPRASPSQLESRLLSSLAAVEAGADLDAIDFALAEEDQTASAAEAAALAAAAKVARLLM